MRLIPVTDLKQWAYCPRIVYYHWVMPVVVKPTYKMREAVAAQDLIEGLEMRRSLAKYGFDRSVRRVNVWLSETGMGLSGKVDMLLESGKQAAVIDFKLTSGEVGENHRMQLAGYSMLAEAASGLRADVAFVLRIPDSQVFPVEITADLRAQVREAVKRIHEMAEGQECPEPTLVVARCRECEFANYCGDVW